MTSVFTQLKLKGTYGLVGNDGIGSGYDRFYYLSEVDMNAGRLVNWGTQLNYNPLGINISRYANDRIGWETAYKTNIGLEATIVGGLSTRIEFFKERRENILLNRVFPSQLGFISDVKTNLRKGKTGKA